MSPGEDRAVGIKEVSVGVEDSRLGRRGQGKLNISMFIGTDVQIRVLVEKILQKRPIFTD